MSKALISPMQTLSTRTCQTATVPVRVSTARISAWHMARLCVTIIVRCRFQRSVNTPATGARKKLGIWLQKPTSPNRNAELVSR